MATSLLSLALGLVGIAGIAGFLLWYFRGAGGTGGEGLDIHANPQAHHDILYYGSRFE